MPEAEQVTVRSLTGEASWAAQIQGRQGREIQLDLFSDISSPKPPALVEIESAGTLRLGVVARRQGKRISVVAEHTVDLDKLARIQELWHDANAK